jgi:hypothetical protein
MRQKIRRRLKIACNAFASEPNTLLAQALIAALLLSLGATATTRAQTNRADTSTIQLQPAEGWN